jgi:phosphatidylserine/phosphatidylglycerophosphate/cardiolipin synthase-like enzyme
MKLKKEIFRSFTIILFISLLIIYSFPESLLSQTEVDFQLVESVPLETSLGSDKTARTLEIWLHMIDSAQNSIDMEIFYLSYQAGKALEKVIHSLQRAANRKVAIRIIADARMAGTYPEMLDSLNLHPNITVRRIAFFNKNGGVMHAKYFLVDDEQLFLGSQNMDWRALVHIHELGVRIRSSRLVRNLKAIFELDWQMAESEKLQVIPELPIIPETELVNRDQPIILSKNPTDTVWIYPTASYPEVTPAGISHDETEIVRLIESAQERLEIQLLSYKPGSRNHFYETLDNSLRKAAARGVQVRMIVSNWNTRKYDIPHLKSLQLLSNIEIRISTMPEYSAGFIPYARVEHCKFMVVDSRLLWLGTSNWSWSYFHNSRNLGMVIHSKGVNQTVHEIFWKSWISPYCETVDICRDYVPPRISGKEN